MFKFQLGDINRNYTVYHTNAPKAYDGFGTITLQDRGNLDRESGEVKNQSRIVAIDEPHIQWQTMRYASGNHFAEPVAHSDNWAVDRLNKRLTEAE